jgi:hypothetical protein
VQDVKLAHWVYDQVLGGIRTSLQDVKQAYGVQDPVLGAFKPV